MKQIYDRKTKQQQQQNPIKYAALDFNVCPLALEVIFLRDVFLF